MINRRFAAAPLLMACLLLGGCARAEAAAESPPRASEQARFADPVETVSGRFTDDPDAIERAAASVVRLEVYDAQDQKIGTGSGFCAFDPSVLITAAHVIVNMDHAIATCDNGESFRLEGAIDGDADSDVALLRLPEGTELDPLPVFTETPRRGERVLTIGSQFGLVNLVAVGNIAGAWETQGTSWLLFTAPVSSGSSGGPILNDNGEVVGVVSSTYDKGQNLNLAAPIEKTEEILATENGMEVTENE